MKYYLLILMLVANIGNCQTLGQKLNNPMCIRSSRLMKNQISVNSAGFSEFKRPVDGLRAGKEILLRYDKKHINTIRKIVKRFTKGDPNPKYPYIYFLSNRLQVCPDDSLDLKDPLIQEKLIIAMSFWESRYVPRKSVLRAALK